MHMENSLFSLAEPPANPSLSLDSEKGWQTRVATWPSSFLGLLTKHAPAGWCGRTSPVSCHRTTDGRLAPSSEGWQNSGMGSPTECWTLSTSEWTGLSVPFRSDGSVCSLSDVLEAGNVPPRYFLSAKACRGILRRAAKRGKELPGLLALALRRVADSEPTSSATAALSLEPCIQKDSTPAKTEPAGASLWSVAP
jgi:hypothetical protein